MIKKDFIEIKKKFEDKKLYPITIEVRWGTSKSRNTYGYTTCNLYAFDRKLCGCNGGGYDLEGTALGSFIELHLVKYLKKKIKTKRTGLAWQNPNWKVPEEILKQEQEGKSLGLERYQAFHSSKSDILTEKHTVPILDGGRGSDLMKDIISDCGLSIVEIHKSKHLTLYQLSSF